MKTVAEVPEPCYLHPQTRAVARCTECRKPICPVCVKTVNAKPYCEACAARREEQSPFLAGLLSLLVPGMGQVYNGEWGKGLVIFLTGWLIAPWIYGIADAVTVAEAIRSGRREELTVPAGYLLLVLKFGIVLFSCFYLSGIFLLLGALIGALRGLLQ